MLERKYTVIFEPDVSGGYIARVPVLPGCVTEGDTLEEASAMAKDAVIGYIECLIQRGLPVPEERSDIKPGIMHEILSHPALDEDKVIKLLQSVIPIEDLQMLNFLNRNTKTYWDKLYTYEFQTKGIRISS